MGNGFDSTAEETSQLVGACKLAQFIAGRYFLSHAHDSAGRTSSRELKGAE